MAKRYEFRYETLLRLRRQREDERKRVVAARLREIRTLEDRRATLENRIREQTEQVRDALRSSTLNLDDLKLSRHWVIRLRRGVLETDEAIKTHRAVLSKERQHLAEAAKDKKVLERLKERRLAEYMAEMDRREQLELDEMNAQRAARAVFALQEDDAS